MNDGVLMPISPPSPSPDSEAEKIILADLAMITIILFLVVGFLTAATRFQLWHSNIFLLFSLNLAKDPMYQFLSGGILMAIVFTELNELYLVSAILLYISYGNFCSIVDYSVYHYHSNKRASMLKKELIHLSNNMTVLMLVVIYNIICTDEFLGLLWVLWLLSLLKILYRMISLYFSNTLYGSENTKWVDLYMKECRNDSTFDPETMKGYKYLIVGEKKPKVSDPPTYAININDQDAVTIEAVWNSKGRLLRCEGYHGKRLKDTCLSFALFKLLGRRFEESCVTAEATRLETRNFVLRGLLEFSHDRVLRVIDTELRFLQDFLYTKYPVTYAFGFPILGILYFVFIFATFLLTFLKIFHNYEMPDIDRKYLSYNRSYIKTDICVAVSVLSLAMLIEIQMFISYFFSNWSKVLLVCMYVRNYTWIDRTCIDKVLRLLFNTHLWGYTTHRIGQYSLLESFRPKCCNRVYSITFGILGYKDGVKKPKYESLKNVKLMEAIIPSVRSLLLTEGNPSQAVISALSNHGVHTNLPTWACQIQDPFQTVLIWHVATSFCSMVEGENHIKFKKSENTRDRVVATSLSKYCAYLVVYAPQLLPIDSFSSELIFDRVISETRNFFSGTLTEETMLDKMRNVGSDVETIVGRGCRLGKLLGSIIGGDEDRWRFLKEFWAELILRLAPLRDSIAHAKKMEEGGEFITYLWVLLYHAGLLDQLNCDDHSNTSPI